MKPMKVVLGTLVVAAVTIVGGTALLPSPTPVVEAANHYPPHERRPEPRHSWDIRGVVTNLSGMPVAGAQVWAWPASDPEHWQLVTANRDGAFALHGVGDTQTSPIMIVATLPGWAGARPQVISKPGTMEHMHLVIRPSSPASRATVTVVVETGRYGRPTHDAVAFVPTSKGRYHPRPVVAILNAHGEATVQVPSRGLYTADVMVGGRTVLAAAVAIPVAEHLRLSWHLPS
ncbi:MAG: hypothetical protein OWU33_09775 [Firmicutes bacterium]|nr:hypothetical protein [Bacillota bacterium]